MVSASGLLRHGSWCERYDNDDCHGGDKSVKFGYAVIIFTSSFKLKPLVMDLSKCLRRSGPYGQ